MSILLSSLLVLSFLFPSVAGFGVGQPLLQQHHPSTTTALHAVPIDTHTTDAIQSMWLATIDADIADIQLEDFRRVFAGGIAVMIGGLISTTILGKIIEGKDLYANLAAESYMDMADDPAFWKQMTEGMSPEEKEKAKVLMEKIKAKRAGEEQLAMASEGAETSSSTEAEASSSPSLESTASAPTETPKDQTAKASNDMFSDY